MSAHALVEHSAYSESWTPASRVMFKVVLVASICTGLAGLIGYFTHQAGLHTLGLGLSIPTISVMA